MLAAYHRKQPREAESCLQRTCQWLDAPSREDPKQSNFDRLHWSHRLLLGSIQAEVETVLKPDSAKPAPMK